MIFGVIRAMPPNLMCSTVYVDRRYAPHHQVGADGPATETLAAPRRRSIVNTNNASSNVFGVLRWVAVLHGEEDILHRKYGARIMTAEVTSISLTHWSAVQCFTRLKALDGDAQLTMKEVDASRILVRGVVFPSSFTLIHPLWVYSRTSKHA